MTEELTLVERLRAMTETCCAGGCDACEAEAQAADRIEELEARYHREQDRIERLIEENQRMREALTEIARLRTDLSGDFSLGSKQSDIARKILEIVG